MTAKTLPFGPRDIGVAIAMNLSLAVADNVDALAIAGQSSVPFSRLLAIVIFHERMRPGALGRVAFSEIGSTVPGQGVMSWLLQRHPVGTVTPLTLAAPVVSVASAAWWFATPVTWPMLAGGGIAMPGVGIVTLRTARAPDMETA